jgi:hypothetical protein
LRHGEEEHDRSDGRGDEPDQQLRREWLEQRDLTPLAVLPLKLDCLLPE